jgi:hypothetical protein
MLEVAPSATKLDLEGTDKYEAKSPNGEVGLEATNSYLRRARADVHRSKAKAANWVALILVFGLVLSLPFYVIAIGLFTSETGAAHIERIFLKWYDVVSPLVGAVVGALFGLSLSDRGREDRT